MKLWILLLAKWSVRKCLGHIKFKCFDILHVFRSYSVNEVMQKICASSITTLSTHVNFNIMD